eukprot:3653715-Pleurochrysis_carterae.AAC.3
MSRRRPVAATAALSCLRPLAGLHAVAPSRAVLFERLVPQIGVGVAVVDRRHRLSLRPPAREAATRLHEDEPALHD